MTIADYKPKIRVTVTPNKVHKGQMLAIQAEIHDLYTHEPMPFDNIYIEIINEKGVPVWPLTLVDNDTYTISKLISTADMDTGQVYTVRVTPSKGMRPMGEAQFEISKQTITPAWLLPGLMLIPEILLQHPKPEDTIIPESVPVKIKWLVYVTQRDSKVCEICAPDDGKMFRATDTDLILLPRHPNCRCHYDIITPQDERDIYQAYYLAQQQEHYDEEMAVKAYLAVQASKKHG